VLNIDGILIEGSEIYMDESSVTGESDLIRKQTARKVLSEAKGSCFLISGSKVMDGSGKMLICTVGINTQIGQLKLKL